ncbi:hypothetical protein RD1_1597 [Roseobacter denitrificans OCh 114]|uniref:Uncharacterized protein n=1 Tax=Roseobacter denitrificans (strain ATCC 33942 / OCh 114) TaxID=375451 RepID=Q169W9_ROSDO|nr:hypothetical protein RD1_1597 [Roseobacter denitrificans OCh 114]
MILDVSGISSDALERLKQRIDLFLFTQQSMPWVFRQTP